MGIAIRNYLDDCLSVSDETMVSRPLPDPTASQVETLDNQSLWGIDSMTNWPCLTIVYHPDLRRIGEQAIIGQLWSKRPVEISRNLPEFAHPGSPERQSLRDPYVSRRPIQLARKGSDIIEIIPSEGVHLYVNEERVESVTRVPVTAVQREGVLLQLSRRIILLLHTIALQERIDKLGLVGESDGICRVRQQIAQVADLDVPVLIRGETGVGKERVAQSIHHASKRAQRACVAVNMAAIPPSTAASELFGHARGAFTGATNRHIGLFERADGGTLFLDEIGETPASIQAMLLRVLEEGKITPMGHTTPRAINVRIIAATDAPIEEGGEDGSFRVALLHRLAGFEIRVPALRERRDDIPRLIFHFIEQALYEINEIWRLEDRGASKQLWFPPALMVRLFHHDWPGNVRQLRNVVRQLVISSRGADMLRVDNNIERVLSEPGLDGNTLPRNDRKATTQDEVEDGDTEGGGEMELDGDLEDRVFAAMKAAKWHIGAAAKRLGVPRTTLHGIIDRHPRLRKAKDIPREELVAAVKSCDGDIDRLVNLLQVSSRGLQLRLTELGIEYERKPAAGSDDDRPRRRRRDRHKTNA